MSQISHQNHSADAEKEAMELASTARQIVEIDKLAREKIETAAKAREARFADVKRQKEVLQQSKQRELEKQLAAFEAELQKERQAVKAEADQREKQASEAFAAAFAKLREELTDRLYESAIRFDQEI